MESTPPPIMWLPILPCWSSHIRRVVCHQVNTQIYSNMWDQAPGADFGRLITGETAWQRVTWQGPLYDHPNESVKLVLVWNLLVFSVTVNGEPPPPPPTNSSLYAVWIHLTPKLLCHEFPQVKTQSVLGTSCIKFDLSLFLVPRSEGRGWHQFTVFNTCSSCRVQPVNCIDNAKARGVTAWRVWQWLVCGSAQWSTMSVMLVVLMAKFVLAVLSMELHQLLSLVRTRFFEPMGFFVQAWIKLKRLN